MTSRAAKNPNLRSWKAGTIADICEQDRKTVRAEDARHLPYLGLEQVESNTGRISSMLGAESIDVPSGVSFLFSPRHVLYGKLRPYLNKVALPEREGVCSTELIPLKPRNDIPREFVAYALRRKEVVNAVMLKNKGARMPRADIDFLLALPLAIPTLPEQRRIVDILSHAEGIMRLQRQAADKAREIIPALFLDMFGDPAANPKDWPMQPFGEIGTLDRGLSKHRPRDAAELYGGPYPFIQTGEVANSGGQITSYSQTYSEAGLKQSRLWRSGTLCITIAANIAKTAVLTFDACFPDSIVGFLPGKEVRTEYVQCWLSFLQPTLEAFAPQAAQKNINLKILRALPVPIPPIELQKQFAERENSIKALSQQRDTAEQRSNELFQSLLHRAFSGAL